MLNQTEKLSNLVLAPYIIKATALIGTHRNVGGNQFRHALATMAILIDYKYLDSEILLKAAVIHDLLEDVPETDESELRQIDEHANQVVDLVLEVTQTPGTTKIDYLKRIQNYGSQNAKILKVADRISNLTDLHHDQYSKKKMKAYLDQTEDYVLPMAIEVDANMAFELRDLIAVRRKIIKINT